MCTYLHPKEGDGPRFRIYKGRITRDLDKVVERLETMPLPPERVDELTTRISDMREHLGYRDFVQPRSLLQVLVTVAEAFGDVGDASLVQSEHELPENRALNPIYDEYVLTTDEHDTIVDVLVTLLFTLVDIPVERPLTRSFEQDHASS